MPMVIVPVGFLMGPEYGPGGSANRDADFWEVHFGTDRHQLNVQEFAAWTGAFRDPPTQLNLEGDRASLEALLHDDGGIAGPLSDAASVVSDLLGRGLLVEFDPVGGPLQESFARLSLYPQGHGLGSTAEEPTRYRIGFAGNPLAHVSANVYQVWSFALRFASLWDACAGMAATRGTDLESLAHEVGTALPVLVGVGTAFLDPRGHEPDE